MAPFELASVTGQYQDEPLSWQLVWAVSSPTVSEESVVVRVVPGPSAVTPVTL